MAVVCSGGDSRGDTGSREVIQDQENLPNSTILKTPVNMFLYMSHQVA